jgi:hypothetical protein
MKMALFWNIVPCGVVDAGRRFRGAYSLATLFFALMMEAVSSSETLLSIYQVTLRNVQQYILHHIHRHEKLKYDIFVFAFNWNFSLVI